MALLGTEKAGLFRLFDYYLSGIVQTGILGVTAGGVLQRWLLVLAAAATVAVLSGVSAWAGDGRRLALVVGNSDYANAGDLPNAVRDAQAISESLAGLGFEVVTLTDAPLAELDAAVVDLAARAEGADATLFFYSGHGFQLGGINHVVPVDAELSARDQIDAQTLRLNDIIGRLQSRDRQTLILLDACRDNPLPEGVRETNSAGLAQIERGDGVYVAFATQPGEVTFDGTGDHSPFTQALLTNIDRPGLSVSDMMTHVRKSVVEQTMSRQTPWEQSALREVFVFNPAEDLNSTLTDADRLELASLSPEMQRKFEQSFGIKIEAVEIEPVEEPTPAQGISIFGVDGDTFGLTEEPPPVVEEPAVIAEPIEPLETAIEPTAPVVATTATAPEAETAQEIAPEPPAPAMPVEEPATEEPVAQEVVEPEVEQLVEEPMTEAPIEAPAEETPTLTPQPVQVAVATPGPASIPTVVQTAPLPTTPTQAANAVASPATTTVAAPATTPAPIAVAGLAVPLAPIAGATRTIANTATGVSAPGTATVVTPTPATQTLVGTEVVQEEDEPIEVALANPEVTLPPAQPAVEIPEDIKRAVQAELKRVGCYTSTVDGLWGNGSARALLRYYVNKKSEPTETEATPALYLTLLEEEGRVCPVEVQAPPKVVASSPRSSSSNGGGSTPRPAAAQPAAQPKPEPAAQPAAGGFKFGSGSFR